MTSNDFTLYLAIIVAVPLIDRLWRLSCRKITRFTWPSDQQLMVVSIYALMLAIMSVVALAGLYLAYRLGLVIHTYPIRMHLLHGGLTIMSFMFGLQATIVLRYWAHPKPRPMHAEDHPHSKGRWYAYQLEHDGPDHYSLHFKKAGLIGLFCKCDVSLKVHPEAALMAVIDMLGSGKTLVLATPNADLYWAVKKHRTALQKLHPQITVVHYAKPMNCFIGAFANLRNKWGIARGKAVICRGYEITT